MKIAIDIKRYKIYLWAGLAFLSLNLFSDLVNNQATFANRAVNNLWLVGYLIVINIIFFEYTLPLLKFTWKKILISLLLIWAHFILYSYGLYSWRYIGIQLHIYTSLKVFSSTAHAVFYIFPYGLSSVFFFGIIRHIYNYIKLKQATQQLRWGSRVTPGRSSCPSCGPAASMRASWRSTRMWRGRRSVHCLSTRRHVAARRRSAPTPGSRSWVSAATRTSPRRCGDTLGYEDGH